MKQEVASFLDYVAHSPTVFQATQQACDMLDAAGFTRLSEHEAWEILPGGRYYVTRNRSALVAFAVPENGFTHCQIVASHGDSPTFKLKAHAEGEAAGAYIRLDVEPYGGMIMSTWFDRPLSIAGRALVREDGRLVTRLAHPTGRGRRARASARRPAAWNPRPAWRDCRPPRCQTPRRRSHGRPPGRR